MYYENDIIVGISTPFAKGAISIIRLSGKGSIELVNKIFKGKDLTKAKSHTVSYGYIIDPKTKEKLDEVLVTVFKSPKTYTKEDVVEINCHGGIYITNYIYEMITTQGARVADAGEFTKRAFLNGRIDLTKAEAVMDVIEAQNKAAVKLANQGINGKIYDLVKEYRKKLLDIIAVIAVNIDYPEYDDVEELTNEDILPKLTSLKLELKDLLQKSIGCKFIKEGVNTVILGKPNVGKSTLLNALVKEEKAIVTNIPGTTRDVIEAKVNLNNITLNLIDTAGIRKTDDVVEKIGVEKSIKMKEQADLILFMTDASTPLTEDEKKLYTEIKDRAHVTIVNKSDVSSTKFPHLDGAIYISAMKKEDIDLLEKEIIKVVLKDVDLSSNAIYLGNSRQIAKLQQAINALEEALKAIENGVFIDFSEMYMKEAYNYLGEIIGDTASDSLLTELFSKFCLGK